MYGLGKEVIDTAFTGTVSRIGGMSLADIQRETEAFWAKGFPSKVGARPASWPWPWPAVWRAALPWSCGALLWHPWACPTPRSCKLC